MKQGTVVYHAVHYKTEGSSRLCPREFSLLDPSVNVLIPTAETTPDKSYGKRC